MSANILKLIPAIFILLPLVAFAGAEESDEEPKAQESFTTAGSGAFYQGKAEGWFWYKDPPPEEKPKKKKIILPPPPPPPIRRHPNQKKRSRLHPRALVCFPWLG